MPAGHSTEQIICSAAFTRYFGSSTGSSSSGSGNETTSSSSCSSVVSSGGFDSSSVTSSIDVSSGGIDSSSGKITSTTSRHSPSSQTNPSSQSAPSSIVPSQSLSMPSQTSGNNSPHTPQAFRTPSSIAPSQSLSTPSQSSVSARQTAGLSLSPSSASASGLSSSAPTGSSAAMTNPSPVTQTSLCALSIKEPKLRKLATKSFSETNVSGNLSYPITANVDQSVNGNKTPFPDATKITPAPYSGTANVGFSNVPARTNNISPLVQGAKYFACAAASSRAATSPAMFQLLKAKADENSYTLQFGSPNAPCSIK